MVHRGPKEGNYCKRFASPPTHLLGCWVVGLSDGWDAVWLGCLIWLFFGSNRSKIQSQGGTWRLLGAFWDQGGSHEWHLAVFFSFLSFGGMVLGGLLGSLGGSLGTLGVPRKAF